MSTSFLASSLTSNQLLALLYLCEKKRRSSVSIDEFLDSFGPRLQNLSEQLRFEVLEAHLMSVEDVDIYNNAVLAEVMKETEKEIPAILQRLSEDSRFRLSPGT